jgi:hypothetical protein
MLKQGSWGLAATRQDCGLACVQQLPIFNCSPLMVRMASSSHSVLLHLEDDTSDSWSNKKWGLCYNFLEGPGAEISFRRSGLIETIQAETYVTQCYGSGSSGACNVHAKQATQHTPPNTTCPLTDSDICISVNSTPYQLDTGPIDSHTDLGINAPLENRVTYQKINTCSPIHSTKFAQIVNANETNEAYYWPPDTRLQQFYYGPILNTNFSYTFEYSEWTPLDNFPYDIQ